MKILIVHPKVPIYGGAEHVIVQEMNYLNRQSGVTADLLIPHCPPVMERDLNLKRGKVMQSSLLLLPRIAGQYDVLQPHNFPASYWAMVASGKPIVWYCHEPPELFSTWWRAPLEMHNRQMTRDGRVRIVVADKFNADRFFRVYNKIPHVIPYGIDYKYWSAKQRKRVKDGTFNIVQVGVVQPYKNQLTTIQTAHNIAEDIPNVTVTICGHAADERYMNVLRKYVDENKVSNVTFTSHQYRQDIRSMYSSYADVVMQPCGPQGGWLTPFEALCAGVPVVASPDMTCSSILEDNKLCRVTRDYAIAIEDIYNRKTAATAEVEGAKFWIKHNLTWDKFGSEMLKLMKDAVSGAVTVQSTPAYLTISENRG